MEELLVKIQDIVQEVVRNETKEIKTRLVNVENKVDNMKTDVEELKATTAELKTDVEELKATTAKLKADVEELKVTTAELKADVEELKSTTKVLKKSMFLTENVYFKKIDAMYDYVLLQKEKNDIKFESVSKIEKTVEHNELKILNHETRLEVLENSLNQPV